MFSVRSTADFSPFLILQSYRLHFTQDFPIKLAMTFASKAFNGYN
uniref:Uncharacterized protein n=1 Tax=Anguilla anguilla TaxID=7936 RepID=A0A0E9RTZ0_ANGAN